MPPKELCYVKEEIGGKTYALVYGSHVNRKLVPTFGEEVLMIPAICIEMQPLQKKILHEEDGWTKKSWPFITMSTKAESVVIPFSHDGIGRFEDLVLVFPKGYKCARILPDWPKIVEKLGEVEVTLETRKYDDCDQVLMSGLNIATLTELLTYLRGNSCPVIVTLSQKT